MGTQADQAGAGAAKGAAIGAGVGTAAEVVPVVGPVIHALAAAIGAISGAIAGAAQDTFHPTAAQAAAWLWIFRLYPGMVFSGVDNAIAPERGARLVRYFRLVSGEVPLGPGQSLYNPSNESCDTPYMCAADPREPLTDQATLDRIFKSWDPKSRIFKLPGPTGYITTPAEAQALLALFRAEPAVFSDIAGWSEFADRRAILLNKIKHLRQLAGETGDDLNLSQIFGGNVTPPAPPAPGAKGAKDARMGAVVVVNPPAPPSHFLLGLGLLAGVGLGAYGLHKHIKKQNRR